MNNVSNAASRLLQNSSKTHDNIKYSEAELVAAAREPSFHNIVETETTSERNKCQDSIYKTTERNLTGDKEQATHGRGGGRLWPGHGHQN